MSDLLQVGEMAAMEGPDEPVDFAPGVMKAVFPSVNQLDPERMAALSRIVAGWLATVARNLFEHIRVPCEFRAPEHKTVSRSTLPAEGEEAFWGWLDGYEGHWILVTIERPFAASICERIFGAPLEQS